MHLQLHAGSDGLADWEFVADPGSIQVFRKDAVVLSIQKTLQAPGLQWQNPKAGSLHLDQWEKIKHRMLHGLNAAHWQILSRSSRQITTKKGPSLEYEISGFYKSMGNTYYFVEYHIYYADKILQLQLSSKKISSQNLLTSWRNLKSDIWKRNGLL